MKTAYVTGATGCVGRNLIEQLEVSGDWDITVLHRASSNVGRLKDCRVKLAEVDLHDVSSVRQVFDAKQIDAVFHVAGNTSHWSRETDEQWRDNVLATRNLVDAALENKVSRFILTSTGATLPYQNLDEEFVTERVSNGYIRTKRLSELEVYRGMEKGLYGVIMHPIIVVGEYDYNSYSQFFIMAKKGKLKNFAFPGRIAFCHARDVAKAHVQAYYSGALCGHYVLGGEYTTWLDFFQRVCKAVDAPGPKKATPKWVLKSIAYNMAIASQFTKKRPQLTPELVNLIQDAPDVSYYDKQKAKKDLDYESSSLDRMISDCVGWLERERMFV